MPQMNKKSNARMGYSSPPIPPIGYRNGQKLLNRRHPHASGHPYMSPVERSIAVKALVDGLVNEHDELQQVPSKTMQRMIEELFSHTQNNSVAGGTSVGDETREDLSTVRTSDGDTTGDDTFGHLDRYLGHSPLNCARECTMNDFISIDDTLSMTVPDSITDDMYKAMIRTQSSSSSHFVLDGEAEELPEAIRLAKQSEQVNTKKNMTSKGNFLKKDRPVPASKLVIEHPTPLKRDKTTAISAGKHIPKQMTERIGTKPFNSALGQEQNTKYDTSATNWLTSKLLLMEVAKSKAKQIDLKNKGQGIKARLAHEKKAEKMAMIALKKQEQERRREMKAAVKEMKLLSIQQRAEEKSARIVAKKLMKAQMMKKKELDEVAAMGEDLRLALVLKKKRKARNVKEKKRQQTMAPYQKKNKKNKFADFSVLVDMHDENDLIAGKPTDLSIVKNEIVGLKEKLSRLQGEEEEPEKSDVMGSIENFFLCIGTPCALTISGENSLASLGENSFTSEFEVFDEMTMTRD